MVRSVRPSALIFDDAGRFDRAAAEAYLQSLRAQSPSWRTPPQVIRHGPNGAAVLKPATGRRARASRGRTWVAAAAAIILPAAIGVAIEFWKTPHSPAAAVQSVVARQADPETGIEAYSVTDPVPIRRTSSAAASRRPRSVGVARSQQRPLVQPAAVQPAAEEPAPDYPSYGILDGPQTN